MEKEEFELTPIEVALDEMRQRVAELEEVVFLQPPDAKKLQLKLQVYFIYMISYLSNISGLSGSLEFLED